MPTLPKTSREIKLRRRPVSLPKATDFEVVDVPLPVAGVGEVLVRNRYTRASASLRMMISEGAEAVEGVPFPALRPGDTLAEQTLGEVVAAPAGSGRSTSRPSGRCTTGRRGSRSARRGKCRPPSPSLARTGPPTPRSSASLARP